MTTSLTVTRFGEREELVIPDDALITFEQGIVGMAHLRRFALLDDQRIDPCRWLQSVDDPDVAFVVVDPQQVLAGYVATLSAEDVADLEIEEPAAVDTWVTLTIHSDPAQSTANLLAPILISRRRRRGKQVILTESGYSLRQPLSMEQEA